MRFVAVVAVLLVSCVAPPAEEEAPWPTRGLALEMWNGPMGSCETARLSIRYVPDATDVCYSTAGNTACTFQGGDIYLPDYERNNARLLAHELAHWLFDCSGLGVGNWNHDEELFVDALEGMAPR